jgi:hypothetical protein
MVKLIPRSAWAETHVEGSPGSLSLRVENAPIIEVLNALAVKMRSWLASISRTLRPGVYLGTLHQVLGGILDGYEYVITA